MTITTLIFLTLALFNLWNNNRKAVDQANTTDKEEVTV